jgi:hypothetical protein
MSTLQDEERQGSSRFVPVGHDTAANDDQRNARMRPASAAKQARAPEDETPVTTRIVEQTWNKQRSIPVNDDE